MKQSEKELLKQEIERIHQKGSGDYETLMRQVGKKFRVLKRNAAQVVANHYDSIRKKKTGIMSRGVGKTYFTGDHMDTVVHSMPRSVNNMIVPSYKKFRKEMLPDLSKALEDMGYFEGLHYFVGRRPPRNWKHFGKPYMIPDEYTNIISWHTGAIYQVISQDIAGAGRGLSSDTEIRDEAALLNKKKLEETTAATLRGSKVEAFLNNPLFGSVWNLSSMPITPNGMWLLGEEKNALMNPQEFAYLEFDVSCNLENLRPGYVGDAKKTALYEWIFNAEFLNIRPTIVMGAYYALLNENKHGYIPEKGNYLESFDCRYDYADDDLVAGLPLIVGVDWGSRINYLVVNQMREEKDGVYLRALNEFWALGEEGEIQSDMVRKFAEYYSVFPTKRIILFGDRQGNNKTGITNETRFDMMINQLSLLGWNIELMSMGNTNPFHNLRRVLWENVLKEDNPNLLKFRINLLNCRNLLISMQNTQTKTNAKKDITKNKSSEKPDSGVHPTHATDPSDAEDHIVFGLCANDFMNFGQVLPSAILSNQ